MPLVPKHIEKLLPYKPGRSIEELKMKFGIETIYKLASNENPYGASPLAMESVMSSLKENYRYPDSAAVSLRNKLAKKFNVNISNVIVGSGSEGIMSAIMRTFLRNNDELIAAENSFIGFKVLANSSGMKINWIPLKNFHHDLKSMSSAINGHTKLIYLANPDNPTGTYFSVFDFEKFMDNVPERVLVILDEAYFEYAQNIKDYPDSMLYRYDNVITLRTFSKVYGLAGFRIGYGFAHEKLITNLLKIKLPFEPAFSSQIAAIAALDDADHIDKTINSCFHLKRVLELALKQHNINYINSSANFITLIFNNKNDSKVFNKYMLNNGIIVRDLSGWGLPKCVRITVGNEKEINYFIKILNKF